jgi:hypothetical protein
MREATRLAHEWHGDLPDDRRLVRRVRARDDATIGRMLVDEGRRDEARAAYRASLRRRPALAPLAWTILLAMPDPWGPRCASAAVALKRSFRPHVGTA